MKEKYFVGIYCPPNPPTGEYSSHIDAHTFGLIAGVGVEHVFGYYEDEHGEQYVQAAFDGCAEHNLWFYPRLKIFDRFLGVEGGKGERDNDWPYLKMSEAEKTEIGEKLCAELSKWKAHKAFGGVFFSDEQSYETYDGMGAASKIFAELCPNKEFHYNNLNYFPDDKIMFYRNGKYEGRELPLTGKLAFCSENRFNRFKVYLDGYLNKCITNYLSCDLYPFAPIWKEVPTSIHRGLYETNSVFASYKKERGVKTLIYIQAGDWDCTFREIGAPEMALHLNVTAAYGLDGFVFFPGCFPRDWVVDPVFGKAKDGRTGLLDMDGKPTPHYGEAKRLIAHLQACAPVLLNAKWLGVCTVGEFEGGFNGVDLSVLPDNECIYRGGLTETEIHAYKGILPEIETASQLFIGVFEGNEGQKHYVIVNNSLVRKTSFTLKAKAWTAIVDGKKLEGQGDFTISELAVGECILLTVK